MNYGNDKYSRSDTIGITYFVDNVLLTIQLFGYTITDAARGTIVRFPLSYNKKSELHIVDDREQLIVLIESYGNLMSISTYRFLKSVLKYPISHQTQMTDKL